MIGGARSRRLARQRGVQQQRHPGDAERKTLIVADSGQGALNVVDPATGASRTTTGVTVRPSTASSDLFQVPTTVARFGDRLATVNAKFDIGLPPTADQYEVVIVDR